MPAAAARPLIVDLESLSALQGPGEEARDCVVERLADAARRSGFFMVTGHGISRPCITACRAAAIAFFEQDIGRKVQCVAKSPTSAGFSIRGKNVYVQSVPAGEGEHLKEILDVGPPDRSVIESDVPGLASAVGEYYRQMERLEDTLSELLSRALARAAGVELPSDFLRRGRGHHRGLLRLNYYPQRNGSSAFRDGAHVDWTSFTILHAEKPGLEILEGRQWRPVPLTPGTFIVFLGEQLQMWSNGVFRAAKHRVRAGVANEGSRLSVVYFGVEAIDPNDSTTIMPVRAPGAPLRFPPIAIRDYLVGKFNGLKAPADA